MTNETCEYELIHIEWNLKYELEKDPHFQSVRDDSGDNSDKHDEQSQFQLDEEGIPRGNSPEETRIRKQIIFDFYEDWKSLHPDKSVYNNSLKANILIRKESVVEAAGHAARNYRATKAVLRLNQVLAGAVFVAYDKVKQGNKNQAKLSKMILMTYTFEDIGTIKLTVGIRRSSTEKIQYGITALAPGQQIEPLNSRNSKKASHEK